MTMLSWNSQYAIGPKKIDDEHKILFDLINEFHTHWNEKFDPKEIALVLNKLIQYSEVHFRDEEAIMEKEDYPKLNAHRAEHEKLIQTIFALNEDFAANQKLASQNVQKFCKHWLVDHIVYADYEFRDFLVLKRKNRELEQAEPTAPPTEKKV